MSSVILPEPSNTGTLYAHLCENAGAGLPRDIYWSVYCPCAPIEIEGEEWETSLACEWLTWSVNDWKRLNVETLASVKRPELIETSYYLAAHHPVVLKELIVRVISGTTRFLVHISGEAQITGFDELDGLHGFAVDFEVEFTGLVIVPENLYPKPCSGEKAATALASFIQLADYDEPQWDRFRYVFMPRS